MNHLSALQAGKPLKQILLEWFVIPDQGKTVGSWLVSVAGVWLIGALFVDRVTVLSIDFSSLPSHFALDFFYGIMAEMTAPKICTWIWGKFFPGLPS